MTKELRALIVEYAIKYNIPPAIVYGVCMTESLMNQYAIRFEPHYKWLFKPSSVKPRTCSIDTEVAFQKTSMGLMQVMGAVYRERGYCGWLSQCLASPRIQLEYGCKHLSAKMKKYGSERGILAYNSGSPKKGATGVYINQYYLDRVLEYASNFE